MALHLAASIDETVTTDTLGYLSFDFGVAYDQVHVTANSPSGGAGTLCSATAEKNGDTTCKVRVFKSSNGAISPAASELVTVSLLAVAH
jgi:hypothetical protein